MSTILVSVWQSVLLAGVSDGGPGTGPVLARLVRGRDRAWSCLGLGRARGRPRLDGVECVDVGLERGRGLGIVRMGRGQRVRVGVTRRRLRSGLLDTPGHTHTPHTPRTPALSVSVLSCLMLSAVPCLLSSVLSVLFLSCFSPLSVRFLSLGPSFCLSALYVFVTVILRRIPNKVICA